MNFRFFQRVSHFSIIVFDVESKDHFRAEVRHITIEEVFFGNDSDMLARSWIGNFFFVNERRRVQDEVFLIDWTVEIEESLALFEGFEGCEGHHGSSGSCSWLRHDLLSNYTN